MQTAFQFSGMFNARNNAEEDGQIFMMKDGGERHIFKAFWIAELALLNFIRLGNDSFGPIRLLTQMEFKYTVVEGWKKDREKEVHPPVPAVPPLHCEISLHRISTLFRQK